jgi:hypothetical protein
MAVQTRIAVIRIPLLCRCDLEEIVREVARGVVSEAAGRAAGTFGARAWPAAASLQKRYQRTMRPNKHTATPLDIHSVPH